MAQKTLKITEQDLHRIIKESVQRVLNEIAPETIASLKDKLVAKRREMYSDPSVSNDERDHMLNRVVNAQSELDRRKYGTTEKPTSVAHRAKYDQRERERRQGTRTYGDHYGNGKRMWRTMPKKDK